MGEHPTPTPPDGDVRLRSRGFTHQPVAEMVQCGEPLLRSGLAPHVVLRKRGVSPLVRRQRFPVINVLPLLRLRCRRTSTPTTGHEAGTCVLPFRLARMVGSGEPVLDTREEIARDDRRVKALMQRRGAPYQKVTMYAMSAQGRIVQSPTRDCRRALVKCSDRNPPSVIRYSADSCTTVCPRRRYHSRLGTTEASL